MIVADACGASPAPRSSTHGTLARPSGQLLETVAVPAELDAVTTVNGFDGGRTNGANRSAEPRWCRELSLVSVAVIVAVCPEPTAVDAPGEIVSEKSPWWWR